MVSFNQLRPTVKADFRPTTRHEAAELSDFLGRMLQLHARSSLTPSHMEWKYWTPRADCTGPRSFTVRHDGIIVAHAATWPVRVRVPGETHSAVHVIDWAADPEYPGVGVWIMTGPGPVAVTRGGRGRRRAPV